MKAGIVTLHTEHYGNRLQNYAVHSLLSKLGIDNETLVPRQWEKTSFRIRKENQMRERYREDPLLAQRSAPQVMRQLRCEEFEHRHIPSRYLDRDRFEKWLVDGYDFFVTGSDRVWAPRLRDNLGQLENQLLSFARPEQRVCLAPSIGVNELEPKWHELFHRELSKYPHLTVREESGAEIIRHLTGRNAQVMLDPTLLVDQVEWRTVSRPLPGVETERPYVLYYFQSREEQALSGEMRQLLEQEIRSKGLCEYRLLDKENLDLYSAGPAEFLWLVDHAALICTDSFYGAIFAILFEKPLLLGRWAADTQDMASDPSLCIASMMRRLEMSHKLPEAWPTNGELLWEAEYTAAARVIARERERVDGILRKMLGQGKKQPSD